MVRVTEIQTRNKTNDADRRLPLILRCSHGSSMPSRVRLRPSWRLTPSPRWRHTRPPRCNTTLLQGWAGSTQAGSEYGSRSVPRRTTAVRRDAANPHLNKCPLWKLYARLLLWNGEKRKAVQTALLNAYNAALTDAVNNDTLQANKEVFVGLLHDLRNWWICCSTWRRTRWRGMRDQSPGSRRGVW